MTVCSFCHRNRNTPGVTRLIEAVNSPGKCICNICIKRSAALLKVAPHFLKVVKFTHESSEPIHTA